MFGLLDDIVKVVVKPVEAVARAALAPVVVVSEEITKAANEVSDTTKDAMK